MPYKCQGDHNYRQQPNHGRRGLQDPGYHAQQPMEYSPPHPHAHSEQIQGIAKRHVSASALALTLFSRSLAAVVSGLKLAYLLDICLTRPQAVALLVALRETHSSFQATMFLQTTAGDQTFFINTFVLDEQTVLEGKVWLRLSHGTYEKSLNPPSGVISAFRQILTASTAPDTLCCWTDDDDATLVALAGALLEYPVVYVPSPDMVLLDVLVSICRVVLTGDNDHVLLQFSYPATVAETPTMSTSTLEAIIMDRYTRRLRETQSEWSSVRVEFCMRSEARLCL